MGEGKRGGGQKFLAPPSILISSSWCPASTLHHFSFSPLLSLLSLSYSLIFMPVPFHLLSSSPFFTLSLLLPFFPLPSFCFFLLISQVHSSLLATPLTFPVSLSCWSTRLLILGSLFLIFLLSTSSSYRGLWPRLSPVEEPKATSSSCFWLALWVLG